MLKHTILAKITILSVSLIFNATAAMAAPKCGNTSAGFAQWLNETQIETKNKGYSNKIINALSRVHYAQATINADRNQHSFKLSFEQFMQKRGANSIIARGKTLKKQHAALFARIEKQYGVPAGPILAIWGMETGFGAYLGKQHSLSALATLAYDCRRSDFFTNQLYATLTLIEDGNFDPNTVGAMHGEIGQTQFLPTNILKYGIDADGKGYIDMIKSSADALVSTANFLKGHGWQAGRGYQEGEPNFTAIEGWNKASVYQRALAFMGQKIDGK